MNLIFWLIGLPFIGGILCLLIPKLKEFLAVAISLTILVMSSYTFFTGYVITEDIFFRLDTLSGFVILAIALFSVLIVLYSLKIIKTNAAKYYSYVLWTLSASLGAVLANNLILLIVFWGFVGLTLYLLIQINSDSTSVDTSTAAKKTFIIIGGSDCLMVFGIGLLWLLTNTFQMDEIYISLSGMSSYTNNNLAVAAFLCLAIAAFTKAGAIPVHTWIPDMAEVSPVSVTAFLPASLDKLLGIYLLARICTGMFQLDIWMQLVILVIGAITIVAAVFMAMMQHDVKKLLAYHAVSQVGYMILGIGTGNPIGIAGGLFHMLNNAIYKSCLFLCAGSVEYRTKTSDLANLGGLAKYMPITFAACLIASLAISGIPPLNGFVSKWMIYQGIIQYGATDSVIKSTLWWIFLAAAMFGSALTLASFMKLIHATFLGQMSKGVAQAIGLVQSSNNNKRIEVSWLMWLPQILLAILCIIFGIFAFPIPLKYFILPAVVNNSIEQITIFSGFGQPILATLLIVIGLIIGLIIYLLSSMKHRVSESYIGTETLPAEARVTGVDFYQTIKDMSFIKTVYNLAENKMFDIYDWGKKIVLSIGSVLSVMHTGNLHTYLGWCLIGLLLLLFGLVH